MKRVIFLSFVITIFINSINAGDVDVKALYNKCANCHGIDGKKSALGVSDIIANWDAKKIEKALLDYKEGIRNAHKGNYGGLMRGQVKSLSQDDIKALAKYISSLGKNK